MSQKWRKAINVRKISFPTKTFLFLSLHHQQESMLHWPYHCVERIHRDGSDRIGISRSAHVGSGNLPFPKTYPAKDRGPLFLPLMITWWPLSQHFNTLVGFVVYYYGCLVEERWKMNRSKIYSLTIPLHNRMIVLLPPIAPHPSPHK